MILSTFISMSLLESSGDFQLPGCNHFSLCNLTFHFEPLICTFRASAVFCRALIFPQNSPGGCSPPPTVKKPLAFMYNWLETQFKSRGFHWLKGILYQTHGSQLCRSREGEQGQLVWGHPGSSVCPVKTKDKPHTLDPRAAQDSSKEGAVGWPMGLFLIPMPELLLLALPGQVALVLPNWCYQTRTEFSIGLPGFASSVCSF